MRNALRAAGVLTLALALVIAFWALRSRSPVRSAGTPWKETLYSALTNPVEFAGSRFFGGIGVSVRMAPAGLLSIERVAANSPAENAGLRAGDLIAAVDGLPTTGRTLTNILESIRGFSGTSVTLTVQRQGATNRECVVQRRSWKRLRGLSYNPYE